MKEESLCQMTQREAVLYMSSTNTVTAYVIHKHSVVLPATLLLKYEGITCGGIYCKMMLS